MRDGESIRASDVRYLPIVSAYARTLGVVEEIDRLCGPKPAVSHGRVVLALILDALSGRTPLFRLPQAFAKLDTEAFPQQAAQHQIRSLPTLALFINGKEVARRMGVMSEQQILGWLQSHV